MTRGLARVLATTAFALAVLCVGISIVIGLSVDAVEPGQVVVHGDLDTPGMRETVEELERRAADGDPLALTFGADYYNAGFAVVVVALLIWIGVGAFIVWSQPRHWAGWLFIIIGAPVPILSLFQAIAVYGMKVEQGSVPFLSLFAILVEFALYPLALLPLLFLLYPDGHLPNPRWRWAVIGLVGGTLLAFLAFLFRPGPFNAFRDDGIVYANPLGIDAFAFAGVFITVGTVAALVSGLSMAVAVVLRYRRSTGEERSQMRLLALVGGIAGVCIASMFIVGLVAEMLQIGEEGEDPPIFPILFGIAAFTIVFGTPAAYVVAIARRQLGGVDVVVRKAVTFAVVAGTITLAAIALAVFVPVALLGSELSGSELVLLVGGIALGLAVSPIRRWARRIADRVVFGGRATPYEALTAFSHRVGGTYAVDDVLPRMARVLAEATGAERAHVSLRVATDLRQVATWPDDAPDDTDAFVVDVVHQGEDLGALSVTMPPDDPMDTSKERLVRDLAAQAGPVLRNVKLIEELRASRQRLVAAQDEERRKLERNLHDGAQQQLVALQVQLRLAEQVMERDPEKARTLVHQLQGSAAGALEDLRELARGIYPPLLADQGLTAALESQARKASLPVEVESDGIGRYARDVESTVYFCTLEALNNIAKYAEATRATVRLRRDDGHLVFEVTDDGRGFDTSAMSYGTGLQGMADRLDAVGGSLHVTSAAGRGTTIAGRVPAPATTD